MFGQQIIVLFHEGPAIQKQIDDPPASICLAIAVHDAVLIDALILESGSAQSILG